MQTKSVLIVASVIFIAGLSFAANSKGAKDIIIPAGKQGDVNFSHQKHQEFIRDCMLCHDLFPQQMGSIKDLIEKGTLKKKQVMTQQCLECHKAKKEAGEKAGPVSCSQCHNR